MTTGDPTHRGQTPVPVDLVGHFKDATSSYLRAFPGWELMSVERQGSIDATAIRPGLDSVVWWIFWTGLVAAVPRRRADYALEA